MWVLYVECIPALCRCTLAEKSEWIARGTSTYTSSGRETNLSIAKRGATDETILYRIWSLLLSLPSLNVKVEFFRLPGEKRRFVGDTSVVCLFRIPYYPLFRTVIHSSVLSLGVVCWLQICIRELILNPLIYLLVSELHVAFCNTCFFRFRIILFAFNEIVP